MTRCHEHPLYAGRPGTVGDRPGNFTVQNADLLLCIGAIALLVAILDTWSEALPPEVHRYISAKYQPTAFPDIRLRKP